MKAIWHGKKVEVDTTIPGTEIRIEPGKLIVSGFTRRTQIALTPNLTTGGITVVEVLAGDGPSVFAGGTFIFHVTEGEFFPDTVKVRVDFFKDSGKWYTEETLEIPHDLDAWKVHEYLPKDRLVEMAAVCMNGPWGFPIMIPPRTGRVL